MSQGNGSRGGGTPIEKAIERRASEEESRERYSRWARVKFAGAAIFGGLAAGGAVLRSSGAVELPAAVAAVAEGLSTAASVGLFGDGLVDLRRADNASRHSSRLVQALVEQELEAGEFIGPPENGNGALHGPEEPAPGTGSITDAWVAQER